MLAFRFSLNVSEDIISKLLIKICIVAAALACSNPIGAQQEQFERRNQLKTPGLCLDTKLPSARVNVMRIVGNKLYVAGQDQVVRAYELIDGKIDIDSVRIYRWPAWREERGEIIAMAVSPDGKKLAIGGRGLQRGVAFEVDLESGKIVACPLLLKDSISAIEFDALGNVWIGTMSGEIAVWDSKDNIQSKMESKNSLDMEVKAIGRLEGGVVCFRKDGVLIKFASSRGAADSLKLPDVSGHIESVAFSSNGRQVGILEIRPAANEWRVAMYDPVAARATLSWRGDFAEQLPVHIFRMEQSDRWVLICERITKRGDKDLSVQSNVQLLESNGRLRPLLDVSLGLANCLTETIKDQLVVATEKPHSLQLWSTAERRPIQTVEGIRPIVDLAWSASEDGFLWKNDLGQSNGFRISGRQLSSGDLEVRAATPSQSGPVTLISDLSTASRYSVRLPNGAIKPIPIDTNTDRFGISGAALQASAKSDSFVALGHQWGTTIYRVDLSGTVRIGRKLIGHQGDVTSLALSPSKNFLLTGGSDGCIACFSLRPWQFHPELGANFRVEGGQVYVDQVDSGSPAWEVGLSAGDRISRLFYNGFEVLGQADILKRLANFEVGKQLDFELERKGIAQKIAVGTRVIQRPLWKFFLAGDDWILWRWRDYFYDCSTEGDTLIGWQINEGLRATPQFLRAEQVRERFHKPGKLDSLFDLIAQAPERAAAPELIPPKVRVAVAAQDGAFIADVEMTVEENALLIGQPTELSLWVGDFRVERWEQPRIPFLSRVRIPQSFLRNGQNRIISRAYSQSRVRGDSDSQVVVRTVSGSAPELWGLTVGIKDYSDSRQKSGNRSGLRVGDLRYTVNDAKSIDRVLKLQSGNFAKVHVASLVDNEATSGEIFKALNVVADSASADDVFVLSLAGHGYCWPEKPTGYIPDSFMFLTANTALTTQEDALATSLAASSRTASGGDTGIKIASLFETLARMKCRKVVLVDACHSGGATEVIRVLTPDFVVGPTVIVASQKHQFAQETPLKLHGLFTQSLLEAFGKEFGKADRNKDELLSSQELFDFSQMRVPKLFDTSKLHFDKESLRVGQMPEFWAPETDAQIPTFSRAAEFFP